VTTNPHQLMRAADITLYRAKAEGKSRITRYSARDSARLITQHRLATALPGALARGEFFCDYQPIVALCDGRLLGVEALIRWRHPRFGLIRPNHFIGVAEETGHIRAIGRWVLTAACEQAADWLVSQPAYTGYMSINVAVGQLRQEGFVDDVLGILADTGLPADRLQLELTESAVPYVVGFGRFRELVRGGIAGDRTGVLKLLIHTDTRRVLGVHVFGTAATELVHLGQTVMAGDLTVDYLVEAVFNVPTFTDAYKVAALDAANRLNEIDDLPVAPGV